MYFVEYNDAAHKQSKAWEITNKNGTPEQEFVTTKIYYRPILPNGVYSSDEFGVGNKNGFFIELLSPNWHLQKPFYWRLEPDLGSGYERIVLYLDRTVEVISAAGFSSYSDLADLDAIRWEIEPAVPTRGRTITNTQLEELKDQTFYQRQESLKPFFAESGRFTGGTTPSLNDNSNRDFHTPGLTGDSIAQAQVAIDIIRIQTLRRMPVGGGAGIGSAIPESELLWDSGLQESALGTVSKKRIVAHHLEDGGAEIVCLKSGLDPDSFEFRSPEDAATDPSNFNHECVARYRINSPDRFSKSGYFIEAKFDNEPDSGVYLYLSENLQLSIDISPGTLFSIPGKTHRETWHEFKSQFTQIKARRWVDLGSLPRADKDIQQGIRDGTTFPWTWSSLRVVYEPIDLRTQLMTDLLIGLIPIFGDVLDISEFVSAIFTGRDRWGEKVSGWDYFYLSLSLVPLLSGLHRIIGNRTRRLNANLERLNAIPRDEYRRIMRQSIVNRSESSRLIDKLFDKIFDEIPSTRNLKQEYLARYLATGMWKNSQLDLTDELVESLQIFTATERHQLLSLTGLRSDRLVLEVFG